MLVVKIYRAWDIRTVRQIQIYSLKRVGSPEMVPKNPKTKKVKAVTKETSKKYRIHHLCNRNYCRWVETGKHQPYTVAIARFWVLTLLLPPVGWTAKAECNPCWTGSRRIQAGWSTITRWTLETTNLMIQEGTTVIIHRWIY